MRFLTVHRLKQPGYRHPEGRQVMVDTAGAEMGAIVITDHEIVGTLGHNQTESADIRGFSPSPQGFICGILGARRIRRSIDLYLTFTHVATTQHPKSGLSPQPHQADPAEKNQKKPRPRASAGVLIVKRPRGTARGTVNHCMWPSESGRLHVTLISILSKKPTPISRPCVPRRVKRAHVTARSWPRNRRNGAAPLSSRNMAT
ncbi:hypothetical protein K438DRAFT_874628 [Mycena galopus ATCC 62051]|nr:hypothetical protein K438DRAFT_874628 [Mycena galopus ATCC 62051]